ncbi:hypothetical protein PAPYR_2855 [Paratrimastix pyriformis]|uniref:Uncharacterized protein n=1 Tax=Paratrimastix pyriformis TaxID=342808 RepID=A0ABQ8UP83_9EUKA|nr:hypothetical protein PAPYR_2855 [Paratrimastix pyriformis]
MSLGPRVTLTLRCPALRRLPRLRPDTILNLGVSRMPCMAQVECTPERATPCWLAALSSLPNLTVLDPVVITDPDDLALLMSAAPRLTRLVVDMGRLEASPVGVTLSLGPALVDLTLVIAPPPAPTTRILIVNGPALRVFRLCPQTLEASRKVTLGPPPIPATGLVEPILHCPHLHELILGLVDVPRVYITDATTVRLEKLTGWLSPGVLSALAQEFCANLGHLDLTIPPQDQTWPERLSCVLPGLDRLVDLTLRPLAVTAVSLQCPPSLRRVYIARQHPSFERALENLTLCGCDQLEALEGSFADLTRLVLPRPLPRLGRVDQLPPAVLQEFAQTYPGVVRVPAEAVKHG